jgi:Flp pilus assembly pilin Flp
MELVKRLASYRSMMDRRKLARDESGAEIVETALVLPIVFMVLLAIFWFGRAYNVYSTITYAAREGAMTAARASCADCGNTLPTDVAVATRVGDVLRASKLDPTQIASYAPAPTFCSGFNAGNSCTASSNVRICRNVQMNAVSSNQPACGTLVTFQYPYQFFLPYTSLNLQLFNLPAAAEVPMEN